MANWKLIKDNYDLKYYDGSLAFVEGLKEAPAPQLNKPGDFYILDEEALRADGKAVCDIDEVIHLIKDSEWPNFEKRVLRPYFSHRVPAVSVVAGGSEAQRQAIISSISPAQMIVWPLMEQDKQFADVPEFSAFNDKVLRDGGLAWALGVIRNFGILLEERSKAADEGERKIFIRLWWGLLAMFLLSNIMDTGPLLTWVHEHPEGFPLLHWPSIAILCLRIFAVILTVILGGGLVLLTGRCYLNVENRFKAVLSAFQNITRQSSLHVGAIMKMRREKLDHLHDDLWAAAITFKEVRWAEDPKKEHATAYRLWASTRSQCIRTAMWVNGRRKSLDDLLVNLHNYILMGYAAQTARAEFDAHFTISSWVPGNGWWRLFFGHWVARLWGNWGWDRLIFVKARFWPRFWRLFWVLVAATLVAAFSIGLLWFRYSYDQVAMSQSWFADLALALLALKLGSIAVPMWFGVRRIRSLAAKLATPDEPKLIIENIKGAMPDEKYTALQVLEKAVTALAEHDANRLLTEEDKHH